MTKRINPRELDPGGGVEGEGVVVGADGQFTVGPVGAAGDFVVDNGGVPALSVEGEDIAAPVEGEWRYFPAEDPATLTAADVAVDDTGFTQLAGTDVQTVLDNLDATGVGTNTALVPLTTTIGGVPELVWTPDNELIFVEVTL